LRENVRRNIGHLRLGTCDERSRPAKRYLEISARKLSRQRPAILI
jgi:hypothetical protein